MEESLSGIRSFHCFRFREGNLQCFLLSQDEVPAKTIHVPTEMEILEEKQRLLQVALRQAQLQAQAPVIDQAPAAPAQDGEEEEDRKDSDEEFFSWDEIEDFSELGQNSSPPPPGQAPNHNDDTFQEVSEGRYDHLNRNDDFVYFK